MRFNFTGQKLGFILTSLIILTVFCSLFFFDIKLESNRIRENSSRASLELDGKVLDAYALPGKLYNVELTLGDQLAGSQLVKNAETFSLKLYKDRHYMLHITESNGSCKVISVYTHLPANDDRLYHFSFIASLKSSPRFNYPSSPAALISYDHQLRDFNYREEIIPHFSRNLYSQKTSGGFNH
jgi:hypothetical protein